MRQSIVGHAALLRLSPPAGRGRSASAIRVRGSLRKGDGNGFKDSCQIAQDVVVPESQHTVVVISKPFVANSIALTVGMLPTVHLNYEATFAANEVDRVKADRFLPNELVSIQPPSAKVIPQRPFRVGQTTSQASRSLGLGLISTAHAETPPHPSRFARRPLPASGERRRIEHST
ncbi:hypothetical protein CI41S_57840 [Bradyrhizobium ivorense]|nr:hypothetical protein CI41S_57840 [Bradyrhizobium ivorense]